MSESAQQQSRIKELIARGREQGYLTYAEVNDHLPDDISDPDQVEEIIQMINDMGINVFETAPDADTLLLSGDNDTDEIAAAEAAAALAAVESDAHRTTDPVRMYMREMGSVELLTREGEIEIAKRIEEGVRELMSALAEWPGTVEQVLAEYDLVATEERKLTDIIAGYLNPVDHVPSAAEQAQIQQEAAEKRAAAARKARGDDEEDEEEEEEEETPTGLDPEEASQRFEALRAQLEKTRRSMARNGRDNPTTQKHQAELSNIFQYFKLTPRQFDPLLESVRSALERSEEHTSELQSRGHLVCRLLLEK